MQHNNFYSLKEKIGLFLLFGIAVLSLIFFLKFHTFAFPEHTITFQITRSQAAQKASDFLTSLGINLQEYKHSTIFTIDENAKTYLERETGVTETAELAKNQVDIWHFTTRFFKPSQQEEYAVSFVPNGRLAGFQKIIAEAAPVHSVTKEKARELAQKFLSQRQTNEWKLVSQETTKKPKRIDHILVWEKKGFRAKEATYRIRVGVLGDTIGEYKEYLQIPEEWQRQYEKETSNNDLAQLIAEAFATLLFGLSMVSIFLIKFRRNSVRLRFARWVAGIVFTITLLEQLNSLPLLLYAYTTTTSWLSFVGQLLILSLVSSSAAAFLALFITAAGEVMYREVFPHKLSLEYMFTRGFAAKSINKAIFSGTAAAIIFFSYVLLYYLLGKGIGIWTPAEVNYTDVYSTVIPWIYPLLIGLLAAVTEEGIFRLFGISFLKRYLKSTWLAITITAISWAFMHSNYPQSPWFARGIEISVIGLILGYLFVRFGIIASFVAHYTFNALQTALAFSSSQSMYVFGSSVLVSLLPALVAVGFLLRARKKGFLSVPKSAYNESFPLQPAPADHKITLKVEQEELYAPLSRNAAILLTLAACAGILLFQIVLPKTTIDPIPASINRVEAEQIAKASLLGRGVDINTYQSSIRYESNVLDSSAIEYISEHAPHFSVLKRIFLAKLPPNYWTARFFRPLQKEEFLVIILPNGVIYGIHHILDENAPGDKLSMEQALAVAKTYLAKTKHYDLNNYRLVDSSQEEKENRTDHAFIFEEKKGKIADATFRTHITISGNEPTNFTQFIKIPEKWEREKSKITLKDFAAGAVLGLAGITVFFLVITTFLREIRNKSIHFKSAFRISGVIVIIAFISLLNSFPGWYTSYQTSTPLIFYQIQSGILAVLGIVVGFFLYAIIIGFAIALWKQYIGRLIPQDPQSRANYVKDAIVAGYTIPLISLGSSMLSTYLLISLKIPIKPNLSANPAGLDEFVPFVSSLSAFPSFIIIAAVAGIALLTVYTYVKKWKYVVLILVIIAFIAAIPQQTTISEVLVTFIQYAIVLFSFYFFIAFVLRKNVASYLTVLYINLLLVDSIALLQQPHIFFQINGFILSLFVLLPFLIYLVVRRRL